MNTHTSKTDRSLLKLKVALTAGGLMATILGAGLLGNQATTYTNANTDAETAVTTSSSSTQSTGINTNMPAELDLNLEAIPTVTAPTFRNIAVARGRSSG